MIRRDRGHARPGPQQMQVTDGGYELRCRAQIGDNGGWRGCPRLPLARQAHPSPAHADRPTAANQDVSIAHLLERKASADVLYEVSNGGPDALSDVHEQPHGKDRQMEVRHLGDFPRPRSTRIQHGGRTNLFTPTSLTRRPRYLPLASLECHTVHARIGQEHRARLCAAAGESRRYESRIAMALL